MNRCLAALPFSDIPYPLPRVAPLFFLSLVKAALSRPCALASFPVLKAPHRLASAAFVLTFLYLAFAARPLPEALLTLP